MVSNIPQAKVDSGDLRAVQNLLMFNDTYLELNANIETLSWALCARERR